MIRLLFAWVLLLPIQGRGQESTIPYELTAWPAEIPTLEMVTEALALPPPDVESERPPAIVVPVQFELENHSLTQRSRSLLDHLGSVMMAEASADHRFRIEGAITSSSGKELSTLRADAVRNYLIQVFDIAPDRLEIDAKTPREALLGTMNGSIRHAVLIINLGPETD